MNFKKFLALGVAGASVLTGGFLLSGCDVTKDETTTNTPQVEQPVQQEKEVSSIKLIESTIPKYIIRNKFYRTNIKATVTYEDKTTKEINVTEDMIEERDREDLKYVGQYNLKINYGGKSTTMYTKVVDERYLLKEVVEANAGKDVTKIFLLDGNESDYIESFDMDNKVCKTQYDNDYKSDYAWLSKGITYYAYVDEDEEYECYRDIDGSNWQYGSSLLNIFEYEDEIITESASEGEYKINSVTQDEDTNNYVLNATWSINSLTEDTTKYEYIFNDDFLLSVSIEYSNKYNNGVTNKYEYDYSPVTVEVPAELKAMEKDAIIDAYENAEAIKEMIKKTLDRDFSTSCESEVSAGVIWLYTTKFDADNKILHRLSEFEGEVVAEDYVWQKGDFAYYRTEEKDYNYLKYSKLDKVHFKNMLLAYTSYEILNLGDLSVEDQSVVINDNGDYVLTIVYDYTASNEIYIGSQYVFNSNGLVSVKNFIEGEEESYTINYSNKINLTVPDEYVELAKDEDVITFEEWVY